MRTSLLFLLLCGSVSIASAEFFVCGNAVRPQCADTVGLYAVYPSSDPSTITDPLCVAVPEGQVQAQKTLLQTVRASHVNGSCHVTRVGGLAAEMTQADKDAVNAAMQAVTDVQNAKQQELATNDFCNSATEAQITTKIATMKANIQEDITDLDAYETGPNSIATITNIATAQALILRMNNALQTALTSMNNKYANAFEKIARCEFAKR